MDLQGKKILFVMMLSAEYGGSLIPSWKHFSEFLKKEYHTQTAWVFPYQPEKEWISELEVKDCVYFVPPPQSDTVVKELGKIITQFQPDVIHTHFEQYDIPVAKAVKRYAPNTRMVWHIHDYMDFSVQNQTYPLLRYIRRRILYALRYHFFGKSAWFVPVGYEMAHFVNHFRKHFFTEPSSFDRSKMDIQKLERTTPLLNGLSLSRLGDLPQRKKNSGSPPFRFLTFGGNFHGKGIDTLLDAGRLLEQNRNDFQIIITKGNNLEQNVQKYLNGLMPSWLKLVPQTEHVGDLFQHADCYISASIMETMSFAIAEAEMFLLPVIQTDIEGTFWNAAMPSVLLFPVGNAAALAEQMEKMMENQEEMDRRALQTRQMVQELLDLDRWCEKLQKIYQGLP